MRRRLSEAVLAAYDARMVPPQVARDIIDTTAAVQKSDAIARLGTPLVAVRFGDLVAAIRHAHDHA